MTTINIHKPEREAEISEVSSAVENKGERAESLNKEEAIKKLREEELKLNFVINKGLVNEEVEKIKSELASLIKELEAINV